MQFRMRHIKEIRQMKRVIAVASFALLAVAALSTPANAQSCGSTNGYSNSQFNSAANFGDRFDGRFGNRFGSGSGFNSQYSAFNNGFGGNIDGTQARIENRINAGISSGRLSHGEAARLQGRYAEIANLEVQLRASGNRLSPFERQRLTAQLSSLNHAITHEMNDGDGNFYGQIAHRGWNRY